MIKYLTMHKNQVLAIQGVGIAAFGKVPFRFFPSIGNTLRGYSSTRYIDKYLFATRLEYRFVPVIWRLGFTVFAGIGDVFSTPGDLAWNRLKYTVGLGLRFVFSRKEKLNVRMDYGFGKNSSGNYIDIMEAY